MRTVAEIDADIAKVKQEMQDVHGRDTEVYARIVGYYRSVRNWNKGKREEYEERKAFSVSVSMGLEDAGEKAVSEADLPTGEMMEEESVIA